MKKYLSGLFVMLSVLLLLVSTAFASTDYTITDVKLTDLKGNSIEYAGGSCMVNVSVTKNTDTADGYVVISSYTEDETLIGFNYLFTSLDAGESATLGAMVSLPDTEKIGKVKAMVWDSLDGMTPLAASKTLIPGEEAEPTPTPTPAPSNTVTFTKDTVQSVSNSEIQTYTDTEGTKTYTLENAEVYVNGYYYYNSMQPLSTVISSSYGDIVLTENESGTAYDRIDVTVYATVEVTSVSNTAIGISSVLFPLGNAGSSISVEDTTKFKVIKNGTEATAAVIKAGDILSLKYDMAYSLSQSEYTEIYVSDAGLKGTFMLYNPATKLYCIDDEWYSSVKTLTLEDNIVYDFTLDYFGRLVTVAEDIFSRNYAIVERYIDLSLPANAGFNSEYDFIDVVTLNGESKRLYVSPNSSSKVREVMNSGGLGSNQAVNATISLENRIIEYKLKTSAETEMVNSVTRYNDAITFMSERYQSDANRLGRSLISNARVLDASQYDAAAPSVKDYKAASLKNISEYVDYSGILVGKNSDNEWAYVIITDAGATYHAGTDFAVAAMGANLSNQNVIDGESVYVLKVIENGNNSATNLNISMDADVYVNGVGGSYSSNCSLIERGAVFFYTVDEYGLVDRIDIILKGNYDYDTIKSLITEEYDSVTPTLLNMINLPAASEIGSYTWFVDVDEKDNIAYYEEIQLFIAPVTSTGSNYIRFGAVEGNETDGLYVNTNNEYVFSVAPDAKIYEFNMDEVGAYAFQSGTFQGFDITDADANGRAWMTNVPANENNLDGCIQFAFVMAVDGEITNALLFNA